MYIYSTVYTYTYILYIYIVQLHDSDSLPEGHPTSKLSKVLTVLFRCFSQPQGLQNVDFSPPKLAKQQQVPLISRRSKFPRSSIANAQPEVFTWVYRGNPAQGRRLYCFCKRWFSIVSPLFLHMLGLYTLILRKFWANPKRSTAYL